MVAGGDGMVHLGANLCAGTGVPLGIIAAGTGNDIARELGLPVRDAAKAVGGGGGGKGDIATAGGKDPAGIDDALRIAADAVAVAVARA